MAKTISFEFDNTEYTLEFTRRTVKDMESEGFSLSAMRDRPVTMFPLLFAGAFRCHHRGIGKEQVQRIYKALPNKEELAESLYEMYNGAIDTLFEEPEDNEKKVQWKTNF